MRPPWAQWLIDRRLKWILMILGVFMVCWMISYLLITEFFPEKWTLIKQDFRDIWKAKRSDEK